MISICIGKCIATPDPSILTSMQLSSEIPGFTCIGTVQDLHQLSRTLEIYQIIRDARDQMIAMDTSDQVTGEINGIGVLHYRCAWANSHILGSCLNVPEPRSQDPKVVELDHVFRCSGIPQEGDYNLCSNVA